MTKKTTIKKSIALLICICLLFGVIFSMGYMSAHRHHKCEGTHCPICAQIAVCEKLVQTISSAVTVIVCSFLMLIIWKKSLYVSVLDAITPISLKVKLLD